MWITGKLTSDEQVPVELGVFEYDGDRFYLNIGKRLPLAGFSAPYGYFAVPAMGTGGMAVSCGDQYLFGGAVYDNADMQPGEVKICSPGGAVIKLLANGEISLNGLIIGTDGVIKYS